MQAGLQLKNAFYSKDPAMRQEYQRRWLSFPQDIKDYIKKNVSLVKLYNFKLKLHSVSKKKFATSDIYPISSTFHYNFESPTSDIGQNTSDMYDDFGFFWFH